MHKLYMASPIGSLSFSSPDPRVLQGRDVNTWHCFPSTLKEMHHSSLWGDCRVFLTGKCKNNYQPVVPGPSKCANI